MAELEAKRQGREFLVELIDEYRKKKGIKIKDMNILDENGTPLSQSYKSMLLSGKRRYTLWQTMQLCKALNLGIYLDGEWIYVADRDFVDTHLHIGERTREEEMSYETQSKKVGDLLVQWTARREPKE